MKQYLMYSPTAMVSLKHYQSDSQSFAMGCETCKSASASHLFECGPDAAGYPPCCTASCKSVHYLVKQQQCLNALDTPDPWVFATLPAVAPSPPIHNPTCLTSASTVSLRAASRPVSA
jgi:hypothetical protein